MANSADPDQLASSEANWSDLHCLQRQGTVYPGSAGQAFGSNLLIFYLQSVVWLVNLLLFYWLSV